LMSRASPLVPEDTVVGLVLSQGIAMRKTQQLFPDQPEVAHMGI